MDSLDLTTDKRPPTQLEIDSMVRQSGIQFDRVQSMVNAGCIIRYSRSGVGVLMLHALPGVFWDEHGREVPPAIAAEAGYDTKELLKQRKKREAILKATQAIEQEYSNSAQREVIAEKSGYQVVSYGLNRYNVEYDGQAINTKGFITDKDTALKTLAAVADDDEAE